MLKTKDVDLLSLVPAGLVLCRGTVPEIAPEGVWVESSGVRYLCDVLRSSSQVPVLAPGDEVIFAVPEDPGRKGVVLGVVIPAPLEKQERLVLEAGREIVIKCGEGTITVNADGKIAIKGTKLLSRATGVNIIKGGAVSIN